MACKHIKESSLFIEHLISSYHRHYNNNLNIIDEESSSAEYSLMSSRSKTPKSEVVKPEVPNKLEAVLSDYNELSEHSRKKKGSCSRGKSPVFLFNRKKKHNLLESG